MGKLLKEQKLKKQLAQKREKTDQYDQIKLQEELQNDFNAADLIQTLEDQGQKVDTVKSQFLRVQQKAKLVNEPETKDNQALQERKVAAVVMKQDIKKWLPIVKKNREAEVINFTKQKNIQTSNLSDVTQALTNNSIGQSIENAMSEVQMAKIDQVTDSRQKPIQINKKLMLHQEMKLQKITDIKQKIYKRLKKQKSEKNKLKLISQLTPAERRKELEKLKVDRAKERITLRHSTKNKFISQLLRFGGDKKSLKQQQSLINNLKSQLIQKANLNEEDIDFDDEDFQEKAISILQRELNDIEVKEKQKSGSFGFLDKQYKQDLQQSKSIAEKLLNLLKNNETQNMIKEDIESIEQEDNDESNQQKQNIEIEEEYEGRAVFNKTNQESTIQNNINKKIDAKTVLQQYAGEDKRVENEKQNKILKSEKEQLIDGLNIKNLKQRYDKQSNKKFTEKDLQQINQDENVQMNLANFNLAIDENENEQAFIDQKVQDLEEQIEPEQQPLKGWGHWAGHGIKERKPLSAEQLLQNKIKKIKEIQKKRKDAQLDNVIISEKRDSKFNEKFLIQKLPHEFVNADQYDQTHGQIIGPEWNSLQSHSNLIQPKVISKAGIVITPVKVPSQIQKLIN